MLPKHPPRHPIFDRLIKPVPPIFSSPWTPIAWDDDKPIRQASGVVCAVIAPCSRMTVWGRQLRALHKLDRSYKTDRGVSRLSAAPLRLEEIAALGQAEVECFGASGLEVKTRRRGQRLYWTLPLMAVVLDRVGGSAVGFVSFQMKWCVNAGLGERQHLDFEVEPGQAWISPKYRRRRWGDLAAVGIAAVVGRHVLMIEQTTEWPRGFRAPVEVTVCADIYSESGAAFLSRCASYITLQLDYELDLDHLDITRVECDPRW